MGEQTLPGLQARYWFVPGEAASDVRLSLEFDPAGAGDGETVRQTYRALRDRLAGGAEGEVGLVTTLAADPLVSADATKRLTDFAGAVLASLDEAEVPVTTAELAFSLPRRQAAELPRDMFELTVQLDLGGAMPAVAALPRLTEASGAAGFAARFEEAWPGFRLASDGASPPSLWCLKTGLSKAAPDAPVHLAVPPLSTVPLSGSIAKADGSSAVFSGVDLDAWWDRFAAELNRLVQLAIDAAPGEAGGRIARVRETAVRALSDRLAPIEAKAGRVPDSKAVRAVFEEAETVELGGRSLIATVAVAVARAEGLPGEPPPMLRGRAMTSTGTAGGAVATPAAVRLERGEQCLAFIVPAPREERARQDLAVRFQGERIDREGVPPFRLPLAESAEAGALQLDLGPRSVPVPLIAIPMPPVLDVAVGGMAAPATMDEALAWSVEIEATARFASQDRLELSLAVDAPPTATGTRKVEASGALFEALARFLSFEADEPLDAGAVDRLEVLAEAVADALPQWRAPEPEGAAMPKGWRYDVDFTERPALIVARQAGSAEERPPWPSVTGFATPISEEGVARYEPEAGPQAEAQLRISVPGFRLPSKCSVQVHARIRRNGGLADAVDPAFVYHSDLASSFRLSPRLERQAPLRMPPAPSLGAALDGLFDPFGDSPSYGIAVAAERVERLDGENGLETLVPLVAFPLVEIGDDAGSSLPDLKRELAAALRAAWARSSGDAPDAELAVTVSLFDEARRDDPLVRLHVRIAVPAGEAWWAS